MSSKIQSLAFVAAEEDALDALAVVSGVELVAVRACCPGSRTCALFRCFEERLEAVPALASLVMSCLLVIYIHPSSSL